MTWQVRVPPFCRLTSIPSEIIRDVDRLWNFSRVPGEPGGLSGWRYSLATSNRVCLHPCCTSGDRHLLLS